MGGAPLHSGRVIRLDTTPLLLLAILLAAGGLVALIVAVRRRAASGRPRVVRTPAEGPQPGERWKADVPFEDEPHRSKERPCLVLGYSGSGYWVVKCTTQAPREAAWRVRVPASRWTPPGDRDGYVDLVPVHLPRARLLHSFGTLEDDRLHRQITRGLRWERALDFTR